MNEDDYLKKYRSIYEESIKDNDYFSDFKKKKLWGKEEISDSFSSYIKGLEEVTPMTRKHFKMIAKVVAAIDDKNVREQVALNFANEIREFNPRFDITRFVDACMGDC